VPAPTYNAGQFTGYMGGGGVGTYNTQGGSSGLQGAFNWAALTPEQQAEYATLTPAQRVQLFNIPTPAPGTSLSGLIGGGGGQGGTPPAFNPNGGGSPSQGAPQPNSDAVQRMIAANPGMQPWVAQAFVQGGITPGGRGSGTGDWQYWQNEALQGAGGDTGYLTGRILGGPGGGGSGGGGGSYGGSGNFTPLAPFQGQSYSPSQYKPQQYAGPGTLNAPTPFSYAPLQQPQTFQPPPGFRPAAPFSYNGGPALGASPTTPQNGAMRPPPQVPQSAQGNPWSSQGGNYNFSGQNPGNGNPNLGPIPQGPNTLGGQTGMALGPQSGALMAGGNGPGGMTVNGQPWGVPQNSNYNFTGQGTSSGDLSQLNQPTYNANPTSGGYNFAGQGTSSGDLSQLNRPTYNQPGNGSQGATLTAAPAGAPGTDTTNGQPADAGPDPRDANYPNHHGAPPPGAHTDPSTGDWVWDTPAPSQAKPANPEGPLPGVPQPQGPAFGSDWNPQSQGAAPDASSGNATGAAAPGDYGPAAHLNDPNPFTYQALKTPDPFQAQAPLDYQALGNIQNYQKPQDFTYQALQKPGAYQGANQFTYSGLQTPGTFNYNTLADAKTFTPTEFQAPTGATEQNDPGYQFRLQQGEKALQASAAARGNLLTGDTAKAIQGYGQDYASNEFQNLWNRALTQNQTQNATNLGAFQTNEATRQAVQGTQYGQAANAYGLNTTTQQNAQAQQYGQALNAAQFNEGNRLNAYQTNAQTGLAYDTAGYQEALGAHQTNASEGLAAYQTNADTQRLYNAQNFSEALGAGQYDAQNRLNAYDTNAQTGLAYNNQQFGQALSANQANFGNQLATTQANEGFRSNAYQNQLAGNQQGFNQGLAAYQTNYGNAAQLAQQQYQNAASTYGLNANTQLAYQGQGYGQAANTWQQNWNSQLGAYQANSAANLGAFQANSQADYNAASLNQNANQFGAQFNYDQAWNAYQSQVQQAQFAANNGLAWSQFGLGAQNQAYNQAANTYGINYNAQYQQPFNNNLALAGLGAGAVNGINAGLGSYGSNVGNLYTGIGNINASGQVGAANPWINYAGGIPSTVAGGIGAYYGLRGVPQAPAAQPSNPFIRYSNPPPVSPGWYA